MLKYPQIHCLTELRVNNKVTVTDICKALGVKKQTVSQWENFDAVPSEKYVPHLAKLLNVTPQSLQSMFDYYTTIMIINKYNIDLNNPVTHDDLLSLHKGIGDKKAQRILPFIKKIQNAN